MPHWLRDLVDGEYAVARFQAEHPRTKVVRLRAGLLVGAGAQAGVAAPAENGGRAETVARTVDSGARWLVTRSLKEWHRVPSFGDRTVQLIHISDLALAIRCALSGSVLGTFNVAGEPIGAQDVARAFGAQVVPFPGDAVARLLGTAGWIPSLGFPLQRLAASLVAPSVSCEAAAARLDWVPQWSGPQILDEWAATARQVGPGDLGEASRHGHAAMSQSAPEASEAGAREGKELYGRALDFFSEAVSAVEKAGDTAWQHSTECDDRTVLEVVVAVARDQYRLALQIKGRPGDVAEWEAPDDPLGFQRLDGWKLAAERARSALGGELTPDLPEGTIESRVPDLGEQTSRMVRLGRCIARAAEVEIGPGDGLPAP